MPCRANDAWITGGDPLLMRPRYYSLRADQAYLILDTPVCPGLRDRVLPRPARSGLPLDPAQMLSATSPGDWPSTWSLRSSRRSG